MEIDQRKSLSTKIDKILSTKLLTDAECAELDGKIEGYDGTQLVHLQLLYSSKVMMLRNLIDLTDLDVTHLTSVFKATLKMSTDNDKWNDIVRLDALHQYCQAYKLQTESDTSLRQAMTLAVGWPGVLDCEKQGKNVTVRKTLDNMEHLICFNDLESNTKDLEIAKVGSSVVQELLLRDVMSIDTLVYRAFRAAAHAYRVYTTWPENINQDVRPPKYSAPIELDDVKKLIDGLSDNDKLHMAALYAATCWRIYSAIPAVRRMLSIKSSIKQSTNDYGVFDILTDAFFDNDNNYIPAYLSQTEKNLRQNIPAEEHVKYGDAVKAECIKTLMTPGPFVCLNRKEETTKEMSIRIAKDHADLYIKLAKKTNISTYIRLRANSLENLSKAFTYFALKIGIGADAGYFNGISMLARSASKVMSEEFNSTAFMGKFPLFTFGPFKEVFMPHLSNAEVAKLCDRRDGIVKLLNGPNGNIIVMGFGVSGAGKTSTLAWLSVKNKGGSEVRTERGIIGYWLDKVITKKDVEKVTVTVTEFKAGRRRVKSGKQDFPDVTSILKYIVEFAINTHDRVKTTPNNPDSSRSHVAVTIQLPQGSKLQIIDLAGSESTFSAKDMEDAMITNDIRHETPSKVMVYNYADYENDIEMIVDHPIWVLNWMDHHLHVATFKKGVYHYSNIIAPLRSYTESIKTSIKIYGGTANISSNTIRLCKDKNFLTFLTTLSGANPTVNDIRNATMLSTAAKSKDDMDLRENGVIRTKLIPGLATLDDWLLECFKDVDISTFINDHLKYLTTALSFIIRSWMFVVDNREKRPSREHGTWSDRHGSRNIEWEIVWGHYVRFLVIAHIKEGGHLKELEERMSMKQSLDEIRRVRGSDFTTGDHVGLPYVNTTTIHLTGNGDYGQLEDLDMIKDAFAFFKTTPTIILQLKRMVKELASSKDYFMDDLNYESISGVISCYLTYTYIRANDPVDMLKKLTQTYTMERNKEGDYINTTLREIQNALLYKSKSQLKGNEAPDFVDSCSPFGCHPLMFQSPCFTSTSEEEAEPKSRVLNALGFESGNSETKVILLGVLDIGDTSKEPVTWLYDRNLKYYEDIQSSLNENPRGLDLLYKTIGLPVGDTPFDTKENFEADFEALRRTMKTPDKDRVEYETTESSALRSFYRRHNQASFIGVMQFLDIMGKLGSVVPCMKFLETDTETAINFSALGTTTASLIDRSIRK